MNFQQLVLILLARKNIVLLALSVTVLTTLLMSLLLPKQYEASISLVVDHLAADPVTGTTMPAQLIPGYMATQADVISSRNVAKKVVKNLKLAESIKWQKDYAKTENSGKIDDWIAEELLENIDVKPSQESSLIQISYIANTAQFSAIVANAFAEAFIQTSIELRAQPAKQRSDWFNNQIIDSRKRLQDAQSVLSNYQQRHGLVVVEGQLDLENSKLVDLSQKLMESQARTNELQSRKEQLGQIMNRGGRNQSIQEVINNPLIQTLKSDLARAESRFAELAKRVAKNHPLYKQTQAEVSALNWKLNAEVKVVLNSISNDADTSHYRDESLIKKLAEQKEKVLALKKQHDEIAMFNREVENAQRGYDAAMQKLTQTRMESEISQANVAILNPAIPPQNPSSPRLLLNLILATFLGSILGITAALVMELMDRLVRSPIDIYDTLDIPVLGVISEYPERKTNAFMSFYQHKNQLPGQSYTNLKI